jgi:hypothetical protein
VYLSSSNPPSSFFLVFFSSKKLKTLQTTRIKVQEKLKKSHNPYSKKKGD